MLNDNMTKSKDKFAPSSDVPVFFPRWREVLHNDKRLSAQEVQSHERYIFSCLQYLKACHRLATIASVLDYLQSLPEDEMILPVMSGHLVKHVEMLQTPWG